MTLQETPEFLPERNPETRDVPREPPLDLVERIVGETTDVPAVAQPIDADVEICARFYSLSPSERDVFALLAAGLGNGDIARRLGTTEMASEFQRMKVFQIMGAGSLIELMVMSKICGLS